MRTRLISSLCAAVLLITFSYAPKAEASLFGLWRSGRCSSHHRAVTVTTEQAGFKTTAKVLTRRTNGDRTPTRTWRMYPQRLSDYGKWPPYYD